MTLEEYRQQFVWSIGEMARKADLDYGTMKRALEGGNVSAKTARALAQMLTRETGKEVNVQDIHGLNASI